MLRMQKTPLLAVLLVLALIGPCVMAMAEEGNALNLPDVLPDGSSLASVRDVFTKVADEATAQELRNHMPHLLGGTEYRYVLKKDGQVKAEWGIVVFEFESEQIALEDFQHLANEVAFVNKNPRFVRIPGAENVPEIKEFLESDLPYACLMNEVVIFPLDHYVVWVDDYLLAVNVEATRQEIWSAQYRASLLGINGILGALWSEDSAMHSEYHPPASEALGLLGKPSEAPSDDWPMWNHDPRNTRFTTSPAPDVDASSLALSWQWRISDFKREDAKNGNVFSEILQIETPLVAGNRVIVAVKGLSRDFFKDVVETILNYDNPYHIPNIDVQATKLYCFDRHTGKLEWIKANPGEPVGITVHDGIIYVAFQTDWTDWKHFNLGGIAALKLQEVESRSAESQRIHCHSLRLPV